MVSLAFCVVIPDLYDISNYSCLKGYWWKWNSVERSQSTWQSPWFWLEGWFEKLLVCPYSEGYLLSEHHGFPISDYIKCVSLKMFCQKFHIFCHWYYGRWSIHHRMDGCSHKWDSLYLSWEDGLEMSYWVDRTLSGLGWELFYHYKKNINGWMGLNCWWGFTLTFFKAKYSKILLTAFICFGQRKLWSIVPFFHQPKSDNMCVIKCSCQQVSFIKHVDLYMTL